MGALQVMCTWIFSQVGVCASLPARILYCSSCMTSKYSHGLVVRFRDGNRFNLGSNPNRTQGSFVQILTFLKCHYYVLLRSHYYVLLQNHYCILLRIITYSITTSLLHHYSKLITTYCYISLQTHYYILLQHYYIISLLLLLCIITNNVLLQIKSIRNATFRIK